MKREHIATYTKIPFSPLNLIPGQIMIEDVAHALSLTGTNGHFKHFYSVAQHAINCALEAKAIGCSANIQLACLLQNAKEAYLPYIAHSDKQSFPAYEKAETKLQKVANEAFGLEMARDEMDTVKAIDRSILYYEFFELMDERIYDLEPIIKSKPDFSLRSCYDVENEFLGWFFSFKGKEKCFTCVGVDGTKNGWIAACVQEGIASVEMFASIGDLCAKYSDTDSVIIDIPIGLPESLADIRPERELRNRLKSKASSVFSTPCRQAVYIGCKQGAKEKNKKVLGKSLSEQSLAICGKIKEVDEFLQDNESWKNRLVESHPEYVFMALNTGTPIYEKKRTKEGLGARLSILRRHIRNIDRILDGVGQQPDLKKRHDDILDAACLAVIGQLGKANKLLTIPDIPAKDKTGLKMQIVYAEVAVGSLGANVEPF